jgi:hypothetical protein
MKKYNLLLLLLTILCSDISAQNDTINSINIKKYYLDVNLLGAPTFPLGISMGQMLHDRVTAEIGIGIMSIGAGADFFITNIRKHRFNLSIGAYASYIFISPQSPMYYFPLEVSYIGKKQMQFKLNAGLLISEELTTLPNSKSYESPYFGFSIGKRFGRLVTPAAKPTLDNAGDFLSKLVKKRPLPFHNTISLGVGIHPYIGVSYERLLIQYIGLQVTAGFLSAGGGINLYFPGIRPKGLSFKTGIYAAHTADFWAVSTNILYVPIGLKYIFKHHMVISADVGPQFESDNIYGTDIYGDIGFAVKIGYGF